MIIPLDPGENQTLSVLLGGQDCKINLYEKSTGTYIDVYIADVPLGTAIKCLDRTVIPLDSYTGFIGRLIFVDNQGTSDPVASGFGTRYELQWLL